MNSTFYTTSDLLSSDVKDQLKTIKNFKKPINIDPSTVKTDNAKMTESEKAFMLAKKYRFADPTHTLKNIWHKSKKKRMGARDIKVVMEIVEEIKASATSNGLV